MMCINYVIYCRGIYNKHVSAPDAECGDEVEHAKVESQCLPEVWREYVFGY